MLLFFQALNKAGQARQTAQDAAAKVADALAKVENISSILCKSYESSHKKPCFYHMQTSKVQISLHIPAV